MRSGGEKAQVTSNVSTSLRASFEAIFARYEGARSEPFKSHPLRTEFEAAATFLRNADPVSRPSTLRLRWSVGQGQWASVPWIAILDSRETTRPSSGVYVVYLFRADMSGAYLTLNQGASSFVGGARPELRRRAALLRERSESLAAHGFVVGTGIDLRSSAPLASSYEDSTIAFKLYERGRIPADEAMVGDLSHVLRAYDALVPSTRLLD